MGKYLNIDSKGRSLGSGYYAKIGNLMADGALGVSDRIFQNNMICVVDNGNFAAAGYAAAGYAYDEDEFEVFKQFDGRPKTWLIYKFAKELAK